MNLTVQLFAAAKEIAGKSEITISVDGEVTAAAVKQALAVKIPALGELIGKSALAVENNYVDDQYEIKSPLEIALIPPVSGG